MAGMSDMVEMIATAGMSAEAAGNDLKVPSAPNGQDAPRGQNAPPRRMIAPSGQSAPPRRMTGPSVPKEAPLPGREPDARRRQVGKSVKRAIEAGCPIPIPCPWKNAWPYIRRNTASSWSKGRRSSQAATRGERGDRAPGHAIPTRRRAVVSRPAVVANVGTSGRTADHRAKDAAPTRPLPRPLNPPREAIKPSPKPGP